MFQQQNGGNIFVLENKTKGEDEWSLISISVTIFVFTAKPSQASFLKSTFSHRGDICLTLHCITDHFSRCQMSSPSIIVVIMDIIMNQYSEFASGSFTHPAPSTFTCSHPDRPGILQHTQVLSEVLSCHLSTTRTQI